MAVYYEKGGSPFGGILDLVAAASMVVPGMQGIAPWVAGARAVDSAVRGDLTGAGKNAIKSVAGMKGDAPNPEAQKTVAAPTLTAPKYTGGPDATDRIQMNKQLLQQQQADSRYNSLLKRYENNPGLDTSGTRYQALLQKYPWLSMNGSVNGKPWLGR